MRAPDSSPGARLRGQLRGSRNPLLLGLRLLAPLELIAQIIENLTGSLSADAGLSGYLGGANATVGFHQPLDRLPCGV